MVRDGAEVKSGADGVIGIDSQFAESLEFQDSIHEFRGRSPRVCEFRLVASTYGTTRDHDGDGSVPDKLAIRRWIRRPIEPIEGKVCQ
jgi:hypothetical protein